MKKKNNGYHKSRKNTNKNIEKNSFAVEEKAVSSEDVKEEKAKEEKVETPKIPPFVTYGGKVTIAEEENIIYYKTRYKFLTAMFKLMGKFDPKGNYNIKDEIKRELVRMNKEIVSSNNEGYRAEISFFGKKFEFAVKITTLDDGMAKASLYLDEYVGKVFEEEYISTLIAEFVDKNDDEFRIRCRKMFNLVDVGFLINEFEVPNIAIKLQNGLDLDLVVGDLFDMASQMYLVRILKLLEETPEGREIIAKYKALLDENDERKRKFSYLRLLLERVIDENGGFEKLNLKKEDKKKLVDDLLLSIQTLKKQSQGLETAIVEVKKGEKKEEKASAPKKPAKKSAKKPAKKDDKKGKKSAKKKEDKKGDSGLPPLVFYIEEKQKKKEVEKVEKEIRPIIKPSTATDNTKQNPYKMSILNFDDVGDFLGKLFVKIPKVAEVPLNEDSQPAMLVKKGERGDANCVKTANGDVEQEEGENISVLQVKSESIYIETDLERE